MSLADHGAKAGGGMEVMCSFERLLTGRGHTPYFHHLAR